MSTMTIHIRVHYTPEDGLCNARVMLDEAYKMTIAVTKFIRNHTIRFIDPTISLTGINDRGIDLHCFSRDRGCLGC